MLSNASFVVFEKLLTTVTVPTQVLDDEDNNDNKASTSSWNVILTEAS